MDVLLEDPLNIQLIQELRQQRNELDHGRKGRLLDPGVQEGAQIPPVSVDQEATVQGPAQGYGLAPGYEDWQSRTRPPQDSRYPQDSTTFGRPPRDKAETEQTAYTPLKVSSVEWSNGNGTDVNATSQAKL